MRADLKGLIGIVFAVMATTLTPAACTTAPVGQTPVHIREARVVSVDRPPIGSGIVIAWAVLGMSTPRHGMLDVHLMYSGEGADLPAVGDLCDMTVRTGRIDGFPARPSKAPAVIASSFACGDKAF